MSALAGTWIRLKSVADLCPIAMEINEKTHRQPSEVRRGRHAGGAARWLGGPATAEGSAPKPTGGPNSPSKPRGPSAWTQYKAGYAQQVVGSLEPDGRLKFLSAPDFTRVIPLNLTEPLDLRTVVRYSLYYRAGNALSRPWDIVCADVDQFNGRASGDHLLDAALSGIIDHEGELSTPERTGSALPHAHTVAALARVSQ
jgi:hypothetical protein